MLGGIITANNYYVIIIGIMATTKPRKMVRAKSVRPSSIPKQSLQSEIFREMCEVETSIQKIRGSKSASPVRRSFYYLRCDPFRNAGIKSARHACSFFRNSNSQ